MEYKYSSITCRLSDSCHGLQKLMKWRTEIINLNVCLIHYWFFKQYVNQTLEIHSDSTLQLLAVCRKPFFDIYMQLHMDDWLIIICILTCIMHINYKMLITMHFNTRFMIQNSVSNIGALFFLNNIYSENIGLV